MKRFNLFAFVLTASLQAGPAWSDTEIGRALVVEYCSGCHAIAAGDASPHPKAPPFRTLSQRYPIDALEEIFVERIDTGHPDMPVFESSPQQIANILDYIASIRKEGP